MTLDWTAHAAPDLGTFERLAAAAIERLPEPFRAACREVVIRVEDYPDEETLEEMACESDLELLGLFRGQGLAQAGAIPLTGRCPNMVWLYRVPMLLYWAEHDEALGHVVTHVLVHEIGHHFGLSDDDMAAIEAAAD